MSDRLSEIEQRAAKATEGPWGGYDAYKSATAPKDLDVVNVRRVGQVGGKRLDVLRPNVDTDIAGERKDWEFIFHARSDVPALVRALRKALEGLRYIEGYDVAGMPGHLREKDVAREARAAALSELDPETREGR